MPSPFRHLLRKTGQDSAAKSAGNEDLERGHRSLAPSTNRSSGLQSSPRGVHLPAIPSITGTLIQGGEDVPHERYNGQHGSAAQLLLTPSGLSRVVGYLPRTTCDSPTPYLTPTRLDMPSQYSLSSSDGDWMGNSGPQCRSSSVPSLALHRSLSPRPPFDPHKHGPALQRLEARGSLKTIPSGQLSGSAFTRSSISWLGTQQEVSGEGHAAKYRDMHLGNLAGQISADTDETSNQQPMFDFSLPPAHFLANNLNLPAVLDRENLSAFVNLPTAPDIESGQFLRHLPSLAYPLPNSEADGSSQVVQQEAHTSQVPPKLHQTQHSNSNREEPVAIISTPNLQPKSPRFERMFGNDTAGRMTGNLSVEGREKQSFAGIPADEHDRQAPTIIASQIFEGVDEFLWSPPPSEDGQEAPFIPYTPIPCHTSSDILLPSYTSGLTSDSKPDVYYSPLPQIDVPIPAGKIDLNSHTNFLSSSRQVSTAGPGEASGMPFRYSGVIMDRASRPMSEIELEEEIRNLPDDRPKFALSMLSSMESMRQMNQSTNFEQIHGEHEPNAGSKAFLPDQVQIPLADAGPGSSQTSSSMSTHYYGGDLSGHKVRSGIRMLPTSRARCHTPPLLFGKSAIKGPEMSDATSTLAPEQLIACFDGNVKSVGLSMTLNSLGEQDWETVSAQTEAHTHHFDNTTCNTKTGSSLADNSDSGNLSLSQEVHHPFCSMKSNLVMQHPAHPRHNYSSVLLKNSQTSQTGDFVQVPQYGHASGGCLPNNNTSSQLVSSISAGYSYKHPSPLQAEHTHPLASLPPIIRLREPSGFNKGNDGVWVQHSHSNSNSSSLALSEGVQRVNEEQIQDLSYKITEDVSKIPRAAVSQNQQRLGFREQPCQSSAWLSTVSEVMSSELSFPRSRDPLTKMTVQPSSEHVDSTPEQKPKLDLESSLAGTTSLGSNLPRSSWRTVSSPIQLPDISLLSRQKLHKQAIQQNLEIGSQRTLANFQTSLAKSSSPGISAMSTSKTKGQFRSYSACGLRPEHYNPQQLQRRSSCESYYRLMDPPSAQRISATESLPTGGDIQQTTCIKTLLRDRFLDLGDNDSRHNHDQKNFIERRGRQVENDDASIENPTTPSTAESQPFAQRGVVHIDAPIPVFDHPVYGHERPWDRSKPGPLRQRPHPKPLGPHLFQRPVARAESPHLHYIPHSPTTELLERHVLFSRIYLIASMVVPPIALVYGHGYMDNLMRLHTAGQINGFRTTEKKIALCWGYGMSVICIFAVIFAITIITASA